jgi:ferredoxin
MEHRGAACSAPQDICMTFNTTAASLTKHGIARRVEKQECHDLLQQAYEHNLVQFGENVREQVNFICNCCGCCCEAMIATRRFAIFNPVHTTNFIPVIDEETCNGCGKCVNVCPVEAMTLVSANNPHKPRMKVARLNEEVCLGCGVCVRSCNKKKSLALVIFDNQVLWSHRAMAGVLGVILKLPPVKQVLASKQLKSLYLESLLKNNKLCK